MPLLDVVLWVAFELDPEEEAEFDAPPLPPRLLPPPLFPLPPRLFLVDRTAATSAVSEGLGVVAATVVPLGGAEDLFESNT